MSTGNRCVIYDDIEAPAEARSVGDLVRRLKPILSELAYYGVTGETAVLEAHEEWRSQYTDRLRDETQQNAKKGVAARAHAEPYEDSRHAPRDAERHAARDAERHAPRDAERHAARDAERHAPRDAERHAPRAAERHVSRDARSSRANYQDSLPEGFRAEPPARAMVGSRDDIQKPRRFENEIPSEPIMRANSGIYTPSRVNSSGVPRALLAIMSGTHPSLKD